MSPPRYFFAQDNSSHWYLVDADRREEWQRWCELDDEHPASWDVPEYAQRLEGGVSQVTFTEPDCL
jgi:ferric-dicitrate binding protein FerR (iron transport regulator)